MNFLTADHRKIKDLKYRFFKNRSP